jgi:type III secretory pathway component EscS
MLDLFNYRFYDQHTRFNKRQFISCILSKNVNIFCAVSKIQVYISYGIKLCAVSYTLMLINRCCMYLVS